MSRICDEGCKFPSNKVVSFTVAVSDVVQSSSKQKQNIEDWSLLQQKRKTSGFTNNKVDALQLYDFLKSMPKARPGSFLVELNRVRIDEPKNRAKSIRMRVEAVGSSGTSTEGGVDRMRTHKYNERDFELAQELIMDKESQEERKETLLRFSQAENGVSEYASDIKKYLRLNVERQIDFIGNLHEGWFRNLVDEDKQDFYGRNDLKLGQTLLELVDAGIFTLVKVNLFGEFIVPTMLPNCDGKVKQAFQMYNGTLPFGYRLGVRSVDAVLENVSWMVSPIITYLESTTKEEDIHSYTDTVIENRWMYPDEHKVLVENCINNDLDWKISDSYKNTYRPKSEVYYCDPNYQKNRYLARLEKFLNDYSINNMVRQLSMITKDNLNRLQKRQKYQMSRAKLHEIRNIMQEEKDEIARKKEEKNKLDTIRKWASKNRYELDLATPAEFENFCNDKSNINKFLLNHYKSNVDDYERGIYD